MNNNDDDFGDFGKIKKGHEHIFKPIPELDKKFERLKKLKRKRVRCNRTRVVSIRRKLSHINNDFITIVKSDYQDISDKELQKLFDKALETFEKTIRPIVNRCMKLGYEPNPLYVKLGKIMEEENNNE